MNQSWKGRTVLVTGGASFIGSHLVDALVEREAVVRVIDDLSSGGLENIQTHLAAGDVEFIHADLREPGTAGKALQGINVVFHLAADHGGRGYVDLHQAGPASNLFLDGLVFWEAFKAGVEKVVFASSGCVYPNFLQSDPDQELYLTEDLVRPPYDADNMYGWAKLMGELTLRAFHQEYGLKAASCRYFTVYGPRGVENHAVVATIAKAFIGQNPFEVWGDGTHNLFLDGLVFWEAFKAGVEKVVFASSGCVYPNFLQSDPDQELYLTEDLVRPPYDADNMYGWAKLMGELTLRAFHQEYGLKAASCRYFTVYGPRGVENHAVVATIAKAFIGQNPFEVWGDGTQIRNWTYIDDIVRGTILAAEKIEDGTALNLGTMDRVRVIDAVKEVLRYTGHNAEIKLRPDMPTGPLNRVADNSLAKKLLGWEPQVPFIEGLHRTIDWYFASKNREKVRAILHRMLTER